MLARLALNFVIYLVFGGGIFAFVALRNTGVDSPPPAIGTIALASVVLALWSGGLTTVIEKRVVNLPKLALRAVLAALLGALSLGGFALILSWVAWKSLPLSFVGLGLVAGGLMHGARAFAKGQPPADAPDDGDGDDDADDGAGPASA
jgi:hypothetical protein